MKEVEALKDEKRNAEQSYRNSMPRNHFYNHLPYL